MPKVSCLHAFRSVLNRQPLPPELASRIEIDQLATKSRMMPFIALCGSVTALVLSFDFWSNFNNNNWICLAIFSVLLSYAMMFAASAAWRAKAATTKDFFKFKRLFVFVSFFTSFSWSLMLMAFSMVGNPMQQKLLFGLSVALISTAVFTGPLFYSLAFWAPVTIGSFLSFGLDRHGPDFVVLICLFMYALLTFFTMIFLDKKMAERVINAIKLEESNEIVSLLLRDFQESSSDWLWETDERFLLKHASPRFAEVLQKPASELQNLKLFSLLGMDQASQAEGGEALEELLANLRNHVAFRDLVVPVMVKDERRWWSLTGKPVFDKQGTFIGYRGVGSDVTAEQRSRERIIYLARYDSLTNLVNRNEFDEVLQQACTQCEWAPFALLYLDLDDFKTINDSYGHATGDAVLSVVAERIRGCIRDGDIAGRLGGDEFAVLVASGDPAEACRVADRIIDRLGRPFRLDDVVLELGISIGIALAPAHGTTAATISKNADLALYRAKLDGRGAWRLFNLDADEFFHDSRLLLMDLRRALAGDQFFLLYQPLVNLDNGRVSGLEALIRWRHPTRGLVMPSSFIPMAEQSGLIGPIGKWVIREVCRMASSLPRSVRIAINLSPAQLRDETLIDAVHQIITETGVSPAQIEFEITEAVNLITCERTLEILRWVRERGIRVTIDDFGTGYSSLMLLKSFPFDKLKIDQSFIRELGSRASTDMIVKSMIELGHNLGMLVTAEGVETATQVETLQKLGCGEAQGYLFATPLPAEELDAFIARQHLPALSSSAVWRHDGADARD